MERLLGAVCSAVKWRRMLAFVLTYVFILSAAMTSTAAWADISQHKTNTAKGEGSPKLASAILQKYERDKDGTETQTPIAGTEFALYKKNDDGTAIRIDTYVTGSDGLILATGLAPGDYYWQETRPAAGYLPETENGQPKKYSFSVSAQDGEPSLTTAYNTQQTGSLALSKTVKNSDNTALTDSQKDIQFEFTVIFSEGNSYEYSIGDATYTVANGGKIYLKSGQIAQFDSIPAAIRYEIIETPMAGYTTTSENSAGNLSENGVTAAFINTYGDISDDGSIITVTKRVYGNAPKKDKNKQFHFVLTINGNIHEFGLTAGETSRAFYVRPGDRYSLIERDYTADGYVQSGVINGAGIVGDTDIEIIQTNTYTGMEYTDIYGVKQWTADNGQWTDELPENITILLKNGNEVVRIATATKADGWKYEFNDLPVKDAIGNDIHYTVEEVRIPGWRPVVSGYNIENVYQSPITDSGVEVEKAVTGAGAPAGETFTFVLTPLNKAPMPSNNTIRITGAGRADFGEITFTTPGAYVYTIAEIDGGAKSWSYDPSVYILSVNVTEDSRGQLIATKTLTKNYMPADKALFINRYDDSGETASVRVTKVWKGEDSNRPDSVRVQLYKDGIPYGNPTALSAANNWTRIWSGLDRGAVWTVDENDIPDGYTRSVSGDQVNGYIITNTKGTPDDQKTSVKVTKVWKGEDANRPQSIAAQLYKNGAAIGTPVILSDTNGWTYTWIELEKDSVWTVDEVNIPAGYSRAVTGDAVNGFVITNTKITTGPPDDDEEVSISGKKTWSHGSNPVTKRPTSITVIIKTNGVVTTQRRISEAENWSWSFSLPKYDGDGKPIIYTVDEAQLDDYLKTVDGYNLINTYWPGTDEPDPSKPGLPDINTPNTADAGNLIFWSIIMFTSFAALILLIALRRRR